eukprot:559955-Alexandrium_andersonii.AAC.1
MWPRGVSLSEAACPRVEAALEHVARCCPAAALAVPLGAVAAAVARPPRLTRQPPARCGRAAAKA